LIVLGDARGHETGKQGNRFAKPGQEKLPIVRAISVGRIDTEVCDVTAGASSPATDGATRPRSPEQSLCPPARRCCGQRRDRGSGIIHSAGCLSLGISRRRRRDDDHSVKG
jgi:hypothetical protein